MIKWILSLLGIYPPEDIYEAQAMREQEDGDAKTPGCRDGWLDCRQECNCNFSEPSRQFVLARAARLRGINQGG